MSETPEVPPEVPWGEDPETELVHTQPSEPIPEAEIQEVSGEELPPPIIFPEPSPISMEDLATGVHVYPVVLVEAVPDYPVVLGPSFQSENIYWGTLGSFRGLIFRSRAGNILVDPARKTIVEQTGKEPSIQVFPTHLALIKYVMERAEELSAMSSAPG